LTFCLVYLLHAYDYCPEDSMVCLCLAIASIGRAMQRQSDNRHHLITQVRTLYERCTRYIVTRYIQAMAFLTQYRKLRKDDVYGMAEVEFNFGRAFHQLGRHPSSSNQSYNDVLFC
jgi:general transcription factor 3C polypeptide 3 (transcription factor C subunit 4)